MKNVFILVVIALQMALFTTSCNEETKNVQNENDKENLSGTVTISGAFALYPMAVKWAEEFKKEYPKVRVEVSAGGAGKGIADALSGMVSIGMVSREIAKAEVDKGAWYIPVAKDAVVPVINTDNPAIQELMNNGVSVSLLKKIFIKGEKINWGEASRNKKIKDNVKAYTRSDACGAADIWAKLLEKKQEDLKGIGVFGDPGITEAVKNDKLAIGFNNICYAYNAATKLETKGIKVLPIDFNNNGTIDDNENFYFRQDSIVKAIIDGRYPSPPARDLYFVTKGNPQNQVLRTFIKWVLTKGQDFVAQNGYIMISEKKLEEARTKLGN